jgi:hypothetical protein
MAKTSNGHVLANIGDSAQWTFVVLQMHTITLRIKIEVGSALATGRALGIIT